MKKLPSVKYLNECFQYVKHTGELIWKTRPESHFPSKKGCDIFNKAWAGTVAGTKVSDRTGVVILKGSSANISHIIWKMHHGVDLEHRIKHIDGNIHNNKIDNLQQCTPKEKVVAKKDVKYGLKELSKASRNKITKLSSDEKFKYVTKTPDGLYLSRININGKQTYVGRYTNAQDAHVAAVNCLRVVNM